MLKGKYIILNKSSSPDKMDLRKGGIVNAGFCDSRDDPDEHARVPQNGSAAISEEDKVASLPPQIQNRVRNMTPDMRAAFLAPDMRKKFRNWPMNNKLKILNMTEGEFKSFQRLSDEEQEEFFNDSEDDADIDKDAAKAKEANKKGITPEMMQRFQNMPPEMRQVFMNMSDKERQKFIEMRKKAADWPEEKRKKMFQKMYKEHMKKQVRDIMQARRYLLLPSHVFSTIIKATQINSDFDLNSFDIIIVETFRFKLLLRLFSPKPNDLWHN